MSYPQLSPRYARLTPQGSAYIFESSFDRSFIDAFKAEIGPTDRRWDAGKRWWIVSASAAPAVARLAEAYFGVALQIPTIRQTRSSETRVITLEYLGRAKDRGNGEPTAFGFADGDWTVIIPESVLRAWFDVVPQAPSERKTFYAILCVRPDVADADIRGAYRRLARQWHPDVCKEPDAAEQFKVIHAAYEALSDPRLRKKYDAGLAFAASLPPDPRQRLGPNVTVMTRPYDPAEYRSPLRCGYLLAEGMEQVGRFVVSKIEQWEDITDNAGRVLVTSWPAGASQLIREWR